MNTSSELLKMLAEKLSEVEAHTALVSGRISQGPDWDALQHARVAVESARNLVVDVDAAIVAEASQAAAEASKALSVALSEQAAAFVAQAAAATSGQPT